MGCLCEPFGVCCLVLLYSLIVYVDYASILFVIPKESISSTSYYIIVGIYQVLLILLVWSHLMCFCSNPGKVSLSRGAAKPKTQTRQTKMSNETNEMSSNTRSSTTESDVEAITSVPAADAADEPKNPVAITMKHNFTLENEWTYCRSCNLFRPPRAHHCRVCERCIMKMDHHCQCINNCVGEYNLKYFIQFTSYACISSLYTIFIIIFSFAKTKEQDPIRIIHLSLMILFSIIFGLFAFGVFCDQMQGITHDQTTIEKMRGERRQTQGRMRMLRQICGTIPLLLWILPLPKNNKRIIEKNNTEIMENNQHHHLYSV